MRAVLFIAVTFLVACSVEGPHFFRPDGGTDALAADAIFIDGLFDGPSQGAFDIAIVNEWRLGVSSVGMSEYEWARIVNTGSGPLDLSTAMITNVVDNHNQIVVDVTWQGATTVIEPGKSAGALSLDASALIVTSGLVTEPAQDTSMNNLRINVTNLPANWIVVNAEVTLEIGNARVTMPLNIVHSGTGSDATAYSASRLPSTPL